MNWRFKWVSFYESDFNYDFHVSATKDELAEGKMYYNYEMGESKARNNPESAYSTRTRPATTPQAFGIILET
jgi:predicted dithiol-disulfide oxidoreductase (DUF899 family)